MAKKVTDFTARLNTDLDGQEYVMLSDTNAVYNTVTATTISSSTVDDSFSDSANGFAGFKVGTALTATGFVATGLNTSYTIATVATDGSKVTVNETLTDTESAGASVTLDGLGINYKILVDELATYIGFVGLPNPVDGATFKDSRATVHTASSASIDFDNGNIQTRTLAGNETLEITAAPSDGSIGLVRVVPGANTLSFGTSIDEWIDGVAPTTIGAKHWLGFWSIDGSTTIIGTDIGESS